VSQVPGLPPIIPATQEEENRKIIVQSQLGKIYLEKTLHKIRMAGWQVRLLCKCEALSSNASITKNKVSES
jgi:hypothetical protein